MIKDDNLEPEKFMELVANSIFESEENGTHTVIHIRPSGITGESKISFSKTSRPDGIKKINDFLKKLMN